MIDQLAKSAVVGTGKLPPPEIADENTVDRMAAQLICDDVESATLLRAGLHSIANMVGKIGDKVTSIPEPTFNPSEYQSARLCELLENAFANSEKQLLCSFLETLNAKHKSIPAEKLPRALDEPRAEIRRLIRPVLGERGRWLATFNQRWDWALEERSERDPDSLKLLWEEGDIAARCQALSELRQTQPADARGLLEKVLSKEKADDRAKLVACLTSSLSDEDEPLLESLLDDRSDQVRQVAARLLSRLPNSKFIARMVERAESMLSPIQEKGLAAERQLKCNPPTEPPKDWLRDGVQKATQKAGVGQRSALVEAVFRSVSPRHWQQKFSLNPAELVAAATGDDFGDSVVRGWTERCLDAGKDAPAEWSLALWDWWYGRSVGKKKSADEAQHYLIRLIAVLPAQEAEARVDRLLQRGTAAAEIGVELVSAIPRPWSEKFAMTMIHRARSALLASDTITVGWASLLTQIATAIPESCFAEALAPWEVLERDQPSWQSSYIGNRCREFVTMVENRRDFAAELAKMK